MQNTLCRMAVLRATLSAAMPWPLKFELLPESLRKAAAQFLQDDIKAKGNHLSTGFVGVSYLLPDLTRAGMVDTAPQIC